MEVVRGGRLGAGGPAAPRARVRRPHPRLSRAREVLRSLHGVWSQHKLGDAAAALTFYGVLAFFPFLLFVVALAGLVVEPSDVQALVGALGTEVPAALGDIPAAQLAKLTSAPSGGLLTFIALTAVVSATTGVGSLMKALNTAYGVTERRPRWRVHALALGVMLAGAVLTLLAGLVALATPLLGTWLGEPWAAVLAWLRLPVAAALMMVLWMTLYAVLPDRRTRLERIAPGAVVGVLVWLLATVGFTLYVDNVGTFGVTYGALAGIVVLLLWMWLSSLALMLGAALNVVLARRAAEAPGPRPPHRHPARATDP